MLLLFVVKLFKRYEKKLTHSLLFIYYSFFIIHHSAQAWLYEAILTVFSRKGQILQKSFKVRPEQKRP